MTKTYKVQGWDAQGALTNNYEVVLDGDAAKRELLKFLKKTNAHVALTEIKQKPKARAR